MVSKKCTGENTLQTDSLIGSPSWQNFLKETLARSHCFFSALARTSVPVEGSITYCRLVLDLFLNQ